jgi:hypothetical protein
VSAIGDTIISNAKRDDKEFLKKFVDTQMFTTFIEDYFKNKGIETFPIAEEAL